MIVGLTGPDADLVARARDWLASRSFDILSLQEVRAIIGRHGDVSDAVHHVLSSPLEPVDAAALRARFGGRFLLVRLVPRDRGASDVSAANPDDLVLSVAPETLTDELGPAVLARLQGAPRPDWDDYFMRIAAVVAGRSNCVKRKVAAILVKDRRIISTGYNGTPRGARNCNEGGCPRCNDLAEGGTALEACLCSHAEENAIVQAAYHGTRVEGATIYSTFSPCLQCTKMIINSGIVEVVYHAAYPLAGVAFDLLDQCGVAVRRCTPAPA